MIDTNNDAYRHADRLISGLGRSVGIEEMCFDEQGRCDLQFDEQRMTIIYDPVAEYIGLEALTMEIPSSPSKEFYPWVLEDNYTSFSNGIGCLALNRDANSIVWLDRRPVAQFDNSSFQEWLAKSIERAEFWVRQLRTQVNSAATGTTEPTENLSSTDVLFRL